MISKKEQKERNLQICEDYENGMEMVDMIIKYKLTASHIYAILGRYEVELRNPKTSS